MTNPVLCFLHPQYPGYRTRSPRGENATLYARYKHDLAH